jgi:hypothetical protein
VRHYENVWLTLGHGTIVSLALGSRGENLAVDGGRRGVAGLPKIY